ncbi:MAG: single-stranded DNA-binding protein [Chitinophagales bacterium]|nr:single-stranded DNA-binding protein [Chitinophagales bacterium]
MVNKVVLVGRLGADPEVRHFDNDTSVANFRIATNESYKDKEGKRIDQTEWHSIAVWRGLAKVAEQYLKKGMLVYVEGKLKTRSWDDKDGNKRYTTEVVADNFKMLGERGGGSEGSDESQSQEFNSTAESKQGQKEEYADDLPF